MTGVETIARIRFEHFQNRKGIKRIARELGLARDTVRRVLRSEATEFNYKRAVQPQPKLGPWVEALTAILEADIEGVLIHGAQGVRSLTVLLAPRGASARR